MLVVSNFLLKRQHNLKKRHFCFQISITPCNFPPNKKEHAELQRMNAQDGSVVFLSEEFFPQ